MASLMVSLCTGHVRSVCLLCPAAFTESHTGGQASLPRLSACDSKAECQYVYQKCYVLVGKAINESCTVLEDVEDREQNQLGNLGSIIDSLETTFTSP